MTNKKVRTERVFQTLAPTDSEPFIELIPESFHPENSSSTYHRLSFIRIPLILFKKRHYADFIFNIENPLGNF